MLQTIRKSGARAAMAAAVMLPQTMIGAIITFAPHDLYTFYDWCGRVYSLSALEDQQLGGLIIYYRKGNAPRQRPARCKLRVLTEVPYCNQSRDALAHRREPEIPTAQYRDRSV
jgi:Cytochrome c oxidase caa3 assembly factor (Caa3_CtaG)